MDEYIFIKIGEFLPVNQFIELGKQTWVKKWMSPKIYFKFLVKELLQKIATLEPFNCFVINDIFSSYKCLIGHKCLRDESNIIGGTGYIDSVNINNMSGVINIGTDGYSRPYCSISGYLSTKKRYCFTIFQRYSDNQDVWQYGTCYTDILPYCGSLGSWANNDIRQAITSMIQGTPYDFNDKINLHPVHFHDQNKQKL